MKRERERERGRERRGRKEKDDVERYNYQFSQVSQLAANHGKQSDTERKTSAHKFPLTALSLSPHPLSLSLPLLSSQKGKRRKEAPGCPFTEILFSLPVYPTGQKSKREKERKKERKKERVEEMALLPSI